MDATEEDARGLEPQKEVHIVRATWRDLRQMVWLTRICFGREAWSWLDVLAALSLPGTVRFMALLNGRAIGFIFGDRRWGSDLGWVASIGVHPQFRRSGIGLRLLEICEAELGCRRVRLTLRPSNAAALQLYEKTGYVPVNTWRGYYQDGEDGLVMEKELTRERIVPSQPA